MTQVLSVSFIYIESVFHISFYLTIKHPISKDACDRTKAGLFFQKFCEEKKKLPCP